MKRREALKTLLAAVPAAKLGAASIAETHGFKLGIISDEITEELGQAADFIASYGLHWAELRQMWGKNLMNSPQEDLDRAKKVLAARKLQVSVIASPIFKWNLPQMPAKAGEKRDEYKASFVESDADPLLEKSFLLARGRPEESISDGGRAAAQSRAACREKRHPACARKRDDLQRGNRQRAGPDPQGHQFAAPARQLGSGKRHRARRNPLPGRL